MLITTENNCDMLHSYSKSQFEKNWKLLAPAFGRLKSQTVKLIILSNLLFYESVSEILYTVEIVILEVKLLL